MTVSSPFSFDIFAVVTQKCCECGHERISMVQYSSVYRSGPICLGAFESQATAVRLSRIFDKRLNLIATRRQSKAPPGPAIAPDSQRHAPNPAKNFISSQGLLALDRTQMYYSQSHWRMFGMSWSVMPHAVFCSCLAQEQSRLERDVGPASLLETCSSDRIRKTCESLKSIQLPSHSRDYLNQK